MFNKVPTDLNFVFREKATLDFWKENQIFEKTLDANKEGETYTFYDGPPTANGKPHIGHVLTRVIKDMIPRYRTMKGCMVPRKAGWDTHGLPVELEVEKMLGLDGKEQIEEYGLEPFIGFCKESVWKYKGMWEDFSRTVGFWADMDNPYVTYDNNFIKKSINRSKSENHALSRSSFSCMIADEAYFEHSARLNFNAELTVNVGSCTITSIALFKYAGADNGVTIFVNDCTSNSTYSLLACLRFRICVRCDRHTASQQQG